MRQVYVNGEYVEEDKAKISVFDRGFLFADGVYEVTAVVNGKLIDFGYHMERLRRSLKELSMVFDMSDDELLDIHRTLLEKNDVREGVIYLQVTRGAADRDFVFPPEDTPASLVLFTQEKPLLESKKAETGLEVVTIEDKRWGRCDIKTVQLLYPSLAKMEAVRQGADDAWLTRDGLVMEGTSNNAFIVTKEGRIITRHLSNDILHGITRKVVLEVAHQLQMQVEERAFTIEEALDAREAFATAATLFVTPITKINGETIGEGKPGEIARRLRETYIKTCLENAV